MNEEIQKGIMFFIVSLIAISLLIVVVEDVSNTQKQIGIFSNTSYASLIPTLNGAEVTLETTGVDPTLNTVSAVKTYPTGQFNGVSSHINVLSSSSLDNTPHLSLSVWIKTSDINGGSGTNRIFSKLDNSGANTQGFNFKIFNYTNTQKRVALQLFNGTNLGTATSTSNSNIPLNEWVYLTATYNGSSQRIYINGILDSDVLDSTTGLINISTNTMWVGFDNGIRYFNGSMSNAQIFNRSLSSAEITTLYNSGRQPVNPNFDGAGFNGVNSWINTQIIPNISSNSYSFSFWLYPQWIGSSAFLGTNESYISLFVYGSGGEIKAVYRNSSGTNYGSKCSTFSNTWKNIIVVYNITNMIIYKDGSVCTNDLMYNPSTTLSGNLYIGKHSTSSYFYNGSMSNAQIFNRSLSSAEITTLYNTGRMQVNPITNGLVASYYLYNDSTDSSGNGNNGVDTNVSYDKSLVASYFLHSDTNDSSGNGNNGVNTNVTFEQTNTYFMTLVEGIDYYLDGFKFSNLNYEKNKDSIYNITYTYSANDSSQSTTRSIISLVVIFAVLAVLLVVFYPKIKENIGF